MNPKVLVQNHNEPQQELHLNMNLNYNLNLRPSRKAAKNLDMGLCIEGLATYLRPHARANAHPKWCCLVEETSVREITCPQS